MSQDFLYHAFATGFAGRITHPFEHVIESQAPSALSPIGGYCSSRVTHYRYKEIVSFRAAYTQAAGTYHELTRSWDTVITSVVEGLNIMGVVEADLITARLSSRHAENDAEPVILPLGSDVAGLRIAGVPVDIEWMTGDYMRQGTYSGVCEAYRDDKDFRARFDQANFADQREQSAKSSNEIPKQNGTIVTSLVRALKPHCDFLTPRGHTLFVPHFGSVAIGQLYLDGNARQLTMLQVQPACAVAAKCTAGCVQTNGKPVPPILGGGN